MLIVVMGVREVNKHARRQTITSVNVREAHVPHRYCPKSRRCLDTARKDCEKGSIQRRGLVKDSEPREPYDSVGFIILQALPTSSQYGTKRIASVSQFARIRSASFSDAAFERRQSDFKSFPPAFFSCFPVQSFLRHSPPFSFWDIVYSHGVVYRQC